VASKAQVIRCPTCGARRRRTSKANAYYWALLHAISEQVKPLGEQFSVEAWHAWAKSRWLGASDQRLPNGKVIVVPASSSDLDERAFAEYTQKVEAWAVGERGVIFEREVEV